MSTKSTDTKPSTTASGPATSSKENTHTSQNSNTTLAPAPASSSTKGGQSNETFRSLDGAKSALPDFKYIHSIKHSKGAWHIYEDPDGFLMRQFQRD